MNVLNVIVLTRADDRNVLDLNMIPKLALPEDWALPGPGAEAGLRMLFGEQLESDHIGLALSWLHEHFNELALAAGYSMKDIPALKPSSPGLSIVDIEHVLCEFSKYARIKADDYSFRPFDLEVAFSRVTRTLPRNWKPAHVAFLERNRKYTNPDADEDGEYEISAILDKGLVDRKLHYKVRWAGWGPDADTWEAAGKLREEAPDIVDDFEQKLAKIQGLLKKFRTNRI